MAAAEVRICEHVESTNMAHCVHTTRPLDALINGLHLCWPSIILPFIKLKKIKTLVILIYAVKNLEENIVCFFAVQNRDRRPS